MLSRKIIDYDNLQMFGKYAFETQNYVDSLGNVEAGDMLKKIGLKLIKLEERLAFIKVAASLGIDEQMSVDTQKRLGMINYSLLVSIINNSALSLIFLYLQMWYIFAGAFAAFLFNAFGFVMMYRKHHNLPRMLFAPVISGVIVYCDYHLAGSTSVRFFLFPVSFLGFLYFSKDDYKQAVLGAFVCLLALVFVNTLDILGLEGKQILTAEAVALVDLLLSSSAFLCTIGVVIIFYVQNIKAEMRLQKEREKLSYIFDTVEEGLLLTDHSGCIQPEYSRYTESLLDSKRSDITQHELIEAVFARSLLTEDTKDKCRAAMNWILGGDEFQWIGNAECFPREFQIKTSQGLRDIHAKWQPLFKNDVITGLLLSLQDITEEKIREAEQKEREVRQQIFQEIVHAVFQTSRDRVENFLQDAVQLLRRESMNELNGFRVGLHTLKGAARTLHLSRLAAAVHTLEDQVAKCQDPANWVACCLEEVLRVQADFKEFLSLLQSVLGTAGSKDAGRTENLMGVLSELAPMASRQCQDSKLEFGGIQVTDRIALWKPEQLKVIKTALMHAITNSIDHGYLFPWQEGRAPKKDVFISIESERVASGQTQIIYRDSGAGINESQLQKLLAKAGKKAQDLKNPFDVLFMDGVSSASQVSQTSGRGVGMPAIQQVVAAVQGTVQVSPAPAGGLQLKILIPDAPVEVALRKSA